MSDYIPHDLQLLILNKFPARTLLRCRCVCKAWKDLVDSRSFILDHLAVQTPRVIAQPEDKRMPFHIFDPQAFPFFDELAQVERNRFDDDDGTTFLSLVASAHGVVCLYDYENLLLLWNPWMGRVLRLPLPEFDRADEHFCGFWIDPSSNHFKVVIFFLRREKTALFSSKKEAWTEVAVDLAHPRFFTWWVGTGAPQILVEGVGHWLVSEFDSNEHRLLTCFDFGQDKFGTIELPRWPGHFCSIMKWGDCVSIVHREPYEPRACDLWALRDGSWSKMFRFRVSLDDAQTVISHGVEDYARVLAKTCKGHLVLYDPIKGCTRLMSESIMPRPLGWFNVAYDFVDSLVFPDSNCAYNGSL